VDAKRERFMTVPVVIGICLAAIAGSGTVFYQTRIANPTVQEYFSFINIGRLLVISHVHFFGYAAMGVLMYTLGRRQGAASDPRFGTLVGLAIAAGILDILSWWGVIYVSSVFRFLTYIAGGSFVAGIMLSGLMVLLACRKSAAASR
jgi:hypothetical protein